jgi:hypothetical protein
VDAISSQFPDTAIRVKRKLRMRITKVRQQTITVPETVIRAHSSRCEREVVTLTKMQAASALEVSEQTLASLIDDGQVHAMHAVSGALPVCKDSLFAATP